MLLRPARLRGRTVLARLRGHRPGARALGVPLLAVTILGTTAAGATAVAVTGHPAARPAAARTPVVATASRLFLAAPARGGRASATSRTGAGPVPFAGATAPYVARLHRLLTADVLVTATRPLDRRQYAAALAVSGVRAVELVDVGRVHIGRTAATAIGVDPSTFRGYTPRLTAQSTPLWQSVARGELTASFDMGRNARLPLGGTLPVTARATVPIRIGAFATVGLAGIDALVSRDRAAALGLPTNNAMVVSAPTADPVTLRQALQAALPGTRVELLREVIVVRDSGEFLTRSQLSTAINAALSRVGRPYVWGATGPGAFDCSGLVGWAYAQAGISLPRTSEQQWFAGPHVPLSDAMPGDLLFWTYDPTAPADVDHVAMYIGNGEMVVAPHTGTYVQISPVWTWHLAGVVRVDPGMASQVGGPRFLVY